VIHSSFFAIPVFSRGHYAALFPRKLFPPESFRGPEFAACRAISSAVVSTKVEAFGGGGCVPLRQTIPGFSRSCQEYILDKEAPDTRFDQCLQGFRVLKKVVTMTCTNSAFCANLLQ